MLAWGYQMQTGSLCWERPTWSCTVLQIWHCRHPSSVHSGKHSIRPRPCTCSQSSVHKHHWQSRIEIDGALITVLLSMWQETQPVGDFVATVAYCVIGNRKPSEADYVWVHASDSSCSLSTTSKDTALCVIMQGQLPWDKAAAGAGWLHDTAGGVCVCQHLLCHQLHAL